MAYGREQISGLWKKVYSPLYILIALIVVIIAGNVCRWLDYEYGTAFNAFNPVLVAAAVFLFVMYICCIRKQLRGNKKS